MHILSPVTDTCPLKKAEGETKVCCQTRYRTQDPRLTSQVPYRLRYAARRFSEKIRLDARQRIHMKKSSLIFFKRYIKVKKLKCLLQFLFGALRVESSTCKFPYFLYLFHNTEVFLFQCCSSLVSRSQKSRHKATEEQTSTTKQTNYNVFEDPVIPVQFSQLPHPSQLFGKL